MKALCRLGMLATSLLALGCPKRTDEEIRKAWEASLRDRDDAAGKPGAEDTGPGRAGPDVSRPIVGWDRVRQLVAEAMEVMELSPDAKGFARIAQAWCAVEPQPRNSEHGTVRVCNPDPPVRVAKHRFTLELGSIGVIGLVALDLSESEAKQLARRARAETERWCADQFRERSTAPEGKERKQPPMDEVHTCTVQGGSTLAVARVKDSAGAWLVSIAVLSAT